MMKRPVAVIPIKGLASAKSRLQPVLPGTLRIQLIINMLRDVLAACIAWGRFHRVAVVTSDHSVAEVATVAGAEWIKEPGGSADLNAALSHATAWAQGVGADGILIFPGDLPLAHPDDIENIITAGRDANVVIVPEHGGSGTNALFMQPPGCMRTFFGINSRRLHRQAAVTAGLTWVELHLTRLGYDMDTPLDMERLSRMLIAEDMELTTGKFIPGQHTRNFFISLPTAQWPVMEAAAGGKEID